MTCYQLTVTGSGTLVPKGVTFPDAYSKTGQGLGFSIHAPLDSYPMPGPELIASGTSVEPQLLTFGTISGSPSVGNGGAKLSSAAPAPASSSAVAKPVSSSAAPIVSAPPKATSTLTPAATPKPQSPIALPSTLATSARPQPSSVAGEVTIKEWAQCGGNGFEKAAACGAGLVCKEWNPYYSQCIKVEGEAPAPAPSPAAPAPSQTVPPSDDEPAADTYTLESFIAFLEKNAGSASAEKIRRMIEALM